MINELITQALELDKTEFLRDFPDELMSDDEIGMLGWIANYEHTYGGAPSLKELMDAFDWFMPFTFVPSRMEAKQQPISRTFEMTIEARQKTISGQIIAEMSLALDADGKVPFDMLERMRLINSLSNGVHRYGSYNRDQYFRKQPIRFPFKAIHKAIGGLNLGDKMTIAARLGVGKSTVVQWIASEAMKDGYKVLFISPEMLASDVYARIDGIIANFNPLGIRQQDKSIMTKIGEAVKLAGMYTGEIYVPKGGVDTPKEIEALIKSLKIDLCIVDGAYLLESSDGRFKANWERIAKVSKELKQIARNTPTRMIAVHQIKRGADTEDFYDTEDIAGSDSIARDSDSVIAIKKDGVVDGQLELQLIKNRFGENQIATIVNVDHDKMTITEQTFAGAGQGSRSNPAKSWS